MSKKIPVSAPQAPLASPFASLDVSALGPLPEGRLAPPPPGPPLKRHRVVLRREKAQRGGKTVIVISQLPTHLSPPEIEGLLREARKALGCGGAVHGREIEIQGDQAARVRDFLAARGLDAVGPG